MLRLKTEKKEMQVERKKRWGDIPRVFVGIQGRWYISEKGVTRGQQGIWVEAMVGGSVYLDKNAGFFLLTNGSY